MAITHLWIYPRSKKQILLILLYTDKPFVQISEIIEWVMDVCLQYVNVCLSMEYVYTFCKGCYFLKIFFVSLISVQLPFPPNWQWNSGGWWCASGGQWVYRPPSEMVCFFFWLYEEGNSVKRSGWRCSLCCCNCTLSHSALCPDWEFEQTMWNETPWSNERATEGLADHAGGRMCPAAHTGDGFSENTRPTPPYVNKLSIRSQQSTGLS